MENIKNFTIIIFLAVLISACGKKQETVTVPNGSDPVPVKVIRLGKQNATNQVTVSGQFVTDDETLLSFKTGGVVDKVFVKEGDLVKKGQLLAVLDLTEIKAQVSQAELAYQKALRDNIRVSNLYKDSVVTLEQFQNSKTGLDVATQNLNAAKFNLSHSTIYAPSNGYVLKKFVNTGEMVGPGNPVLQTNGAGKKSWVLKAGISDKEWSFINVNDNASIITDAFPDETIPGRVIRKSNGTDAGTGTFSVEIEVKNPKVALASGLFGSAVISTSKKVNIWSVPYEAVLEGNSGKGYVFITNDNKTALKTEVSISGIDKDKIYVSKGLEGAQALIVSGSPYLSDRSIISIIK